MQQMFFDAGGRARLADREPAAKTIPFEFGGQAGEYFKIWIVNVLLSILTLGIYSAWAKVRRKRYFYGNTRLAGASFEYLAAPVQILKGRLIALAIFVIYVIAGNLFPPLGALFGLAFVILLPWLVVRAHRFNARYSAYRNIRFAFVGGYGEAIWAYVGLPVLSAITLGLLYPYYACRRSRFVVHNSLYGTTRFGLSASWRAFYTVYLKAAGLVLGALLVAALVFGLGRGLSKPAAPGAVLAIVVVSGVTLIIGYLAALTYVRTAISNLVWSHTSVGEHRFHSSLRSSRMLWLYASNALAILLSLGLLIPWAQIRVTRYRLDNLKLLPAGELDGFVAGEQQKVGAAGEEISDFFDIDIGI
jgi:uncharacterized membrane protein YjgN (DUF898 family)